jgi:hypothetical protein
MKVDLAFKPVVLQVGWAVQKFIKEDNRTITFNISDVFIYYIFYKA